MVLVCNTSINYDNYLCQLIFLNPRMHDKVIGQTQTGFIAQSLSADCDHEPWPSDMVLLYDISSIHDYHLC